MDHISELLYKKITGEVSPAELDELERWAVTDARRRLLMATEDNDSMGADRIRRNLVDTSRPMAEMQRRISQIERPRRIRRYAAAAAVTLLLGGGVMFFARMDHGEISENIAAVEQTVGLDDIKPGTVKATLTTLDGETIALAGNDSASIADKIGKSSKPAGSFVKKIEELCLDVPRGGEYMVVLEDSTKVWLNSQSQLRCPAVFSDNERRVKVTGEVYFEVQRDEKRPFYVETEGQVIRVYGTRFNVKAYDDEETVYTTLESGSISLTTTGDNGGELFLAPGHQARLHVADSRIDMHVVDTEAITGWRHGQFVFEEQRLEDIMRDLSRWYDFEYRFDAPELRDVVFKGNIARYSDFMTALAIIETSGNILFSMDDGVVVISRK